jgi:hypothetical protein
MSPKCQVNDISFADKENRGVFELRFTELVGPI